MSGIPPLFLPVLFAMMVGTAMAIFAVGYLMYLKDRPRLKSFTMSGVITLIIVLALALYEAKNEEAFPISGNRYLDMFILMGSIACIFYVVFGSVSTAFLCGFRSKKIGEPPELLEPIDEEARPHVAKPVHSPQRR